MESGKAASWIPSSGHVVPRRSISTVALSRPTSLRSRRGSKLRVATSAASSVDVCVSSIFLVSIEEIPWVDQGMAAPADEQIHEGFCEGKPRLGFQPEPLTVWVDLQEH